MTTSTYSNIKAIFYANIQDKIAKNKIQYLYIISWKYYIGT